MNDTEKERQLKTLKQALANLEKADEERQRVRILVYVVTYMFFKQHLSEQSAFAKRRKIAAGKHTGPPPPDGKPPR